MDFEKLAELLYPHVKETPEDVEKRYPPRTLPEGAKVTRFAPSPTGFVHFGGMYQVMIDERLAHQSGGVLFLRIEDT
ncbi:MAG: glutamate--tRNA ligase, partial [Clostridia bacterium]|nr:glutamate--tRNA ligase [Clostridia bacterium]